MQSPDQKMIERKKIEEALLADRLGLNEPWIERREENGHWKEESCAPARIGSRTSFVVIAQSAKSKMSRQTYDG